MRSTTSRRWSERDYEHIKENLSIGIQKLAEYFGVSDSAMQKRLSLLKLSTNDKKPKPEPKEVKMDNTEKFNPRKHKIKNNSTVGLIKLWIPEERMHVFHKPNADVDVIKTKYANRHKPIV